MISRHWRGVTRTADADRYISHLEEDTFPQLGRIAGFVSATLLRRPVAAGCDPLDQRLRRRGLHVDEGDAGALRTEMLDDALADARTAAGDEDDPVAEARILRVAGLHRPPL